MVSHFALTVQETWTDLNCVHKVRRVSNNTNN